MSETYYIKYSSFDDINGTLVENEATSFVIGPGELNGPDGIARESDLELYGYGVLKWGEGVNQNLFRLLEGWACPQKEDGDFLPGTDEANGFVPGTGSYVATGSPTSIMLPKDERDLGTGNGITTPPLGMRWFNTTDDHTYEYKVAGWVKVGYEVTVDLTTHINDDGLHLTPPQNIFMDGLILGGSPASLQSHDVNQLIGISDVDGTIQDQLDLKVDTRGDAMVGSLTMTGTAQVLLIDGSSATPGVAFASETTTGFYTSGSGFIHASANGTIALDLSSTYNYSRVNHRFPTGTAAAPALTHATDTNTGIYFDGSNTLYFSTAAVQRLAIESTGRLTVPASSSYETLVTHDDVIPNKKYVDDEISASSNIGKIVHSGSSGSTTVPDGVTRAEIYIVGAGGGGASGGDGGNWSGDNGDNGGNTSVTVPSIGTRQVYGGLGGRQFGHVLTGITSEVWSHGRRVRGYGWGVENPGNQAGPGAGNGPPTRGGDGGSTMYGYGGAGSSSFGTAGGNGYRGGGGGGGVGQDNAAGEGGGSGKEHTFVASVTPGQTISWTIGSAGAGGDPSDVGRPTITDRNGGNGGGGYILIRWA